MERTEGVVKAIKVLHVLSSISLRTGGPAVALAGLAAAQARRGSSVTVLVSDVPGHDNASVAQQLENLGIRVRLLGPALGRRATHPGTAQAVREECARVDVVHIHAMWESIQWHAVKVALSCGRPYVVRTCGMLDPWSLERNGLLKKVVLALGLRRGLRSAAALHCTTELEADNVRNQLSARRIIVEPNGVTIPPDPGPNADAEFRAAHRISADCPIVLFLGRIHYKKGLDLLVEAVRQLVDRKVAFQVVVAGSGESSYEREFNALIQRHDVSDRILQVGLLSGVEKQRALAAADVFVLPSRQENFGVSVAEAMAAGLPVIISDQVALKTAVTEAGAGLVVPLGATPLASAIERLVADSNLRNRYADAGKAYAAEHFDWDRIAQRWSDHYRELANLR